MSSALRLPPGPPVVSLQSSRPLRRLLLAESTGTFRSEVCVCVGPRAKQKNSEIREGKLLESASLSTHTSSYVQTRIPGEG